MANLGTTLNPDEIERGQNGFDPFPAGKYVSHIIESEVIATRSGTGLMLKLTWEIIEGEHEKRRAWQNINYQNDSAQAQLIGQQQIKAICEAVGHTGLLEDSEVLHFKPCLVRYGIEKGKPRTDGKPVNYEDKNDVRSVEPLTAQAPAGKAPATAPNPSTARQTQNGGSAASTTKPGAARPAPAPGGRPWQKSA